MSSDNLETAYRMIEATAKGLIDDSIVTDDIHWWAPGIGLMNREVFESVLAKFKELRAGPGKMTVTGTTAQGDRVAAEAEAEIPLKNGTLYQNTYHFLFQFRDGKICLAKEYNDSLAADRALGPLLKEQ